MKINNDEHNKTTNKKLLLVLNGESYRYGGQGSRGRGIKNYIERQLLASTSHIDLINVIENKFNIKTDIIIDTYKLNELDDAKLLEMYKNKKIVKSIFNDNLFSSEIAFLNDMHDNIVELLDDYDFVLYVRIDLYLKKYFIENIQFDDDKIMIGHIVSNGSKNAIKTVSHHIILYPQKYFYVIHDKIIYNATHNIYIILNANYISRNNIYFFVNSLHICATDLGWNPINVEVGRPYNTKYNIDNDEQSSVNKIYDPDSNTLILNNDIIKYWNEFIANEEKTENKYIMSIINI